MLKPNSRILVMAILSMILPLASTAQTDYAIPHTQVTHRVIVVHKVTHSPEKYPRRWAKMQKSPLQPGPAPGN